MLAVVSAAAFGAYFYAAAVAGSLSPWRRREGVLAYGGDVQGVVSDNATIPRDLQFPAARVDFANQIATLDRAIGTYADVLAVDSRKVGSIIHWDGGWGRDPRPQLSRLGTAHPTTRCRSSSRGRRRTGCARSGSRPSACP